MAKRIKAGQLNRESSGSPGAPTCQEAELIVPSRMLLTWTWMLAFGLMARQGEAQSCTQAYGGPNLARGQPTSESSTYIPDGQSSNAVDGNCDGRWSAKTLAHTNGDLNAWWSVDLGREYAIALVVVKNRQDCCGERIRGATIHLGDSMGDFSEESFTCGSVTDLREGSLTTIHCNGALGRFVTIAIPGRKEYLTLAEVEVYGTSAPSQCQRSRHHSLRGIQTSEQGSRPLVPSHRILFEKTEILDRSDNDYVRRHREAVEIHKHTDNFNRKEEAITMKKIWLPVLKNTRIKTPPRHRRFPGNK